MHDDQNTLNAPFKEVVIASDLHSAKEPETRILGEVMASGYNNDAIFAIKLALEEAMTNAVKHGNCCDRRKRIIVRYQVTRRQTTIIIRDEGAGFCPDHVPDPTAPDRLPLPNGRGIMLMRAYMNEVEYRRNGTEIRLVKVNE